jgi:uncharacterized protein (DUF4415 family)
MTVRRRSATESRIYVEFLALLDAIERAEAAAPPPVGLPMPPPGTHPDPDGPARVHATLFLDEETAKWIRSTGRGFQARVNRVLRNYMTAATARAEARERRLLPAPRRFSGDAR